MKNVTEFFEMKIGAAMAAGDMGYALIIGQLYMELEAFLERGKYIEHENLQ